TRSAEFSRLILQTLARLWARLFFWRACPARALRRHGLDELGGEQHRPARPLLGLRRPALRFERNRIGRAADGRLVVARKPRAGALVGADEPERARLGEAIGDEPELVALAGLRLGRDAAYRGGARRDVDGEDEGRRVRVLLQHGDEAAGSDRLFDDLLLLDGA